MSCATEPETITHVANPGGRLVYAMRGLGLVCRVP